jgi:hypothetical protein
MSGRITGVMAIVRRHDAQFAARLAALIADRYDAQARVPAGQHGGGQFASSSGGGGGGPSKSQQRRAAVQSFTNAAVERAIKSGATHKQVKAIREIEHRAHVKVQRAGARLAAGTQQTLFSKAPKQPGAYRLAKAVGGGTAVGIANKALVHAAAQKGLAEHAARVGGRKSTPPAAAAPHAGTAAAASLRPASPIMSQTKAEHAAAVERLKNAPRIHGDKSERELQREQEHQRKSEGDAREAIAHAERKIATAEKAGHHDDAHKWRGHLANEKESHATATTRLREVENEIAHREKQSTAPAAAPAAGGKTAEHSAAEQRLTKAKGDLEKMNTTGYGAANRRYVESDVARLTTEVQGHERAAASGTAYRPPEPTRAGFGPLATPPTAAAQPKPAPTKTERPLGGVSNYDLEAAQNQHISTLTQMSHDISVRARRAGVSAADFERDVADPSHPQHELHKRFQSAKQNVRSHVEETEHRRETRQRETEATAAREGSARAAGMTERKYARPVERPLTKGERDTNKQIDQHDREVERLTSSMDKHKDPARRREVNAQIDRVHRERERLELTLAPGVRNAHETNQAVAHRAKLAKAAERRAKKA